MESAPVEGDLERALASVRPSTSGVAARFAQAHVLERLGTPVAPIVLGRFEVHERLGAGAFSIVYRARDPILERDVALKVLRPEALDADARGREGWLSESRALARVVHPNVVTVHEAGIADDQPYMVMELVDGQTLRAWLRQRQPAWREAVRQFIGIGRGLAAIHEQGIVHRDFKPENVLVDSSGTPRVADLGLARSGDAGSEGGIVGTLKYMAPEQRDEGLATASSDQYAYALAMAEALTGRLPADARDWVKSGPESVPRWLRRVIERGLAVEPERRWPSMDAMVDELAARSRRRGKWTILAFAVGVAGAAVGVGAPLLRAETCTQPPEAWSAEAKARVRAALLAVDRPYAASTWQSVELRLDAYAKSLALAPCDRGPQELQAQRRACLTDRRHALEDLVAVLERADARVLTGATSMASSLPSVEHCLDPHELSTHVGLRMPERWEAVQSHLRRSRQEIFRGDLDAASAAAESAVAQAGEFGDASLRARALERFGHVKAMAGDSQTATHAWREGYLLAVESGEDDVCMQMSERLARHLGANLRHFDEGLDWADTAAAWATRTAASPARRATIADARGTIFVAAGRHEDGLASFDAALAARAKSTTDNPLVEAEIQANRGNVLIFLGRRDDARTAIDRAHALFVGTLGEDHPLTARPLEYLAWLERDSDPELATRLAERALEIRVAGLGEAHPDVAVARINLAAQHAEADRLDEAQALYDLGLPTLRELQHPQLGQVLDLQATILHQRGRYAEADQLYAEAADALSNAMGTQHPLLAVVLADWAETKASLGQFTKAVEYQQRAVTILEAGDGDPATLADARTQLAELRQRLATP